jgi:hypothetical protein
MLALHLHWHGGMNHFSHIVGEMSGASFFSPSIPSTNRASSADAGGECRSGSHLIHHGRIEAGRGCTSQRLCLRQERHGQALCAHHPMCTVIPLALHGDETTPSILLLQIPARKRRCPQVSTDAPWCRLQTGGSEFSVHRLEAWIVLGSALACVEST